MRVLVDVNVFISYLLALGEVGNMKIVTPRAFVSSQG
jgi:predicted nucleic acid-binding protein